MGKRVFRLSYQSLAALLATGNEIRIAATGERFIIGGFPDDGKVVAASQDIASDELQILVESNRYLPNEKGMPYGTEAFRFTEAK